VGEDKKQAANTGRRQYLCEINGRGE